MDWATDDSGTLFLPPQDRHEAEPPTPVPDESQEAMRRLRLPFAANFDDVLEQQRSVPIGEGD